MTLWMTIVYNNICCFFMLTFVVIILVVVFFVVDETAMAVVDVVEIVSNFPEIKFEKA